MPSKDNADREGSQDKGIAYYFLPSKWITLVPMTLAGGTVMSVDLAYAGLPASRLYTNLVYV